MREIELSNMYLKIFDFVGYGRPKELSQNFGPFKKMTIFTQRFQKLRHDVRFTRARRSLNSLLLSALDLIEQRTLVFDQKYYIS